jgi:hypothetical protein
VTTRSEVRIEEKVRQDEARTKYGNPKDSSKAENGVSSPCEGGARERVSLR